MLASKYFSYKATVNILGERNWSISENHRRYPTIDNAWLLSTHLSILHILSHTVVWSTPLLCKSHSKQLYVGGYWLHHGHERPSTI